jgi:putative phage-type endonuclease
MYDREAHRKYLGGSDASAVLGLSRWQTPLQLWAEKTGEVIKDEPATLAQTLGIRLEEVVAEMFTLETGKKVRRVNKTLYHSAHSFIGANIDREVVGEDELLECKTASAWKSKEWEGEEIPREYIIQVMHYLAVTGRSRGYLAVLIGNQDFKIKVVERDENMIAEMVKKEVAFWNDFVVPKVMPGIITARDSQVLYDLFPVAEEGSEVSLDDKANRLIESRNAMILDIKSLESQVDKAENELKAMLQEKETGASVNWIVTWKNQKTKRLDTTLFKTSEPAVYEKYLKESESRVLRFKAKKETK